VTNKKGNEMPAIVVDDLHKAYGETRAVQGVSFSVDEGACVALLGPNGAGKTTTLEVLEGYLKRDRGRVEVLGRDPQTGTRSWREGIGIVLQGTAVDPYLTVRETLSRTAGFYPAPRPVDEVIELVGLTEKANSRVNKLSGGQQRRLDVAYGIVGNPRLLFLDEPTTGFDPEARRQFWDLIRSLRTDGTTIVLTTHYLDEAEALADRIAVIAAGRIVATGDPGWLGGRSAAAARVSWIPIQQAPRTTVQTATPTQLVAELSRQFGGEVPSLTVTRPTLEDTYLELIAEVTP
jgi:ABC-2 type transport system ATP-binding protein